MPPVIPRLANLALLALFPLSWQAPLARAGFLPFLGGSEVSVLSGVESLYRTDLFLAALVALFAIAAPYAKTLAVAAIQFGRVAPGPRLVWALEVLAKLSMADVFLLAVYLVVVKGVGVGYVETGWGLYLFTGLVLASMWITHATRREVDRGAAA